MQKLHVYFPGTVVEKQKSMIIFDTIWHDMGMQLSSDGAHVP